MAAPLWVDLARLQQIVTADDATRPQIVAETVMAGDMQETAERVVGLITALVGLVRMLAEEPGRTRGLTGAEYLRGLCRQATANDLAEHLKKDHR